ncbi:MAG: DUF1513 domain-containing protein [Pseudomonadota bacterium]
MPLTRRRQLLKGAVGLGLLAALPDRGTTAPPRYAYVAAQGRHDAGAAAGAGVAVLDAQTGEARTLASSARGHDVIAHPGKAGRVLMFARRPGFAAWEFDVVSGMATGGYALAEDRQAYGHGAFSADGKRLYSCEGVVSSGRGLIVVRDAQSYAVLAEWDSGGIGPHELKLMPDGQTLVIANGGTLTRPASGARILNLDSMVANLSYMNAEDGSLLETVRGPHPRASIRHLDVASDGTVALAMQYQRLPDDPSESVPLVAMHRRGHAVTDLIAPDAIDAALKGYLGSVRICSASGIVAATSPRGNLAVFWRLREAAYAGYHALHDVWGLAVSPDERRFVLTNSRGEFRAVDSTTLTELTSARRRLPSFRWDNHLTTVQLS